MLGRLGPRCYPPLSPLTSHSLFRFCAVFSRDDDRYVAAGVAVGPAALFVLRGLVCLQVGVGWVGWRWRWAQHFHSNPDFHLMCDMHAVVSYCSPSYRFTATVPGAWYHTSY